MPGPGEAAAVAPSPPGPAENRLRRQGPGAEAARSAPSRREPSAGEPGSGFPSPLPSSSSFSAVPPTGGSHYGACANPAIPRPLLPTGSSQVSHSASRAGCMLPSSGGLNAGSGCRRCWGGSVVPGSSTRLWPSLPCRRVQCRFFGACGEC